MRPMNYRSRWRQRSSSPESIPTRPAIGGPFMGHFAPVSGCGTVTCGESLNQVSNFVGDVAGGGADVSSHRADPRRYIPRRVLGGLVDAGGVFAEIIARRP